MEVILRPNTVVGKSETHSVGEELLTRTWQRRTNEIRTTLVLDMKSGDHRTWSGSKYPYTMILSIHCTRKVTLSMLPVGIYLMLRTRDHLCVLPCQSK